MRSLFALACAAILWAPAYSQTVSQTVVTPNASPSSSSQPNPLLSAKDSTALFERSVQLIESTSATVPGLVRAAAPVLENARQALANLQSGPAGHAGLVYDLLINVRAYLALADSLPKPYPFPDEAAKQFSELRETAGRMESHFRAALDQKERQIRSPDRDNLRRYADADARLAKPAINEKRIVFLGDSITDGWRLNEYFPNRDFVNRGISGQITGEMLGRMKADVIDLKPAGMLVLAGTNDLARGVALSTIENNLTMIADLADLYKIKPIFSSVLPVSDYHKDVNPRYEMSKVRPPSQIIELNRWIEAFCKQRRYPYLDYFSKMIDQSGYMRAELADDGLHPNSAGYRVMGPLALETIDKLVARPAVPPPPPPVIITSKKAVPKPHAKPVTTHAPANPAPVTSATPPPASAPVPVTSSVQPAATPAVTTPPKPKPVVKASSEPKPPPKPKVTPKPAPKEVAAKPAPKEAAAKPAPKEVAAKPPVVAKPEPKTQPKPVASDQTAAKAADDPNAAPKKKKESFWKRTYPDTPPKTTSN